MTYYGAKELAESFRTVRGNTIAIAQDIPDAQYGFRATPDTRSVAELLYHVAAVPAIPLKLHGELRLSTLEGFDFFGFVGGIIAKEKDPHTKAELLGMLRTDGDRFASWLETLGEDFLAERVTYPAGMTPPTKTRFEMIMSAKEHEMHHRAQLMVIERMLGVTPHLTRQMMERFEAMQQRSSAKA